LVSQTVRLLNRDGFSGFILENRPKVFVFDRRAAHVSAAIVSVHVAEVFSAGLDFSGPSQSNLVLETGGVRRVSFHRGLNRRELLLQQFSQPFRAINPV
jgi:hypothetical protein